jgi:osmoprotectant transport system permease protein
MTVSALRAVLWTLAVFALGVWAQARGLPGALSAYWPDVSYLSVQHVTLAAVSGGIAIAVGVPLGVLLTRSGLRRWGPVVMQVAGLGTTIPTLAILALAMTVLGLGTPPALFGLAFLTLLPILINTVSGLRAVPQPLLEAARGMGMTGWQILTAVELPNAAFVIMAGIRTAVAINIGTVPLAFLIGGGGLGELIFTGIDLMEPAMLIAGALSTAALAILADMLIAAAQYWLVPRGVNPLR